MAYLSGPVIKKYKVCKPSYVNFFLMQNTQYLGQPMRPRRLRSALPAPGIDRPHPSAICWSRTRAGHERFAPASRLYDYARQVRVRQPFQQQENIMKRPSAIVFGLLTATLLSTPTSAVAASVQKPSSPDRIDNVSAQKDRRPGWERLGKSWQPSQQQQPSPAKASSEASSMHGHASHAISPKR